MSYLSNFYRYPDLKFKAGVESIVPSPQDNKTPPPIGIADCSELNYHRMEGVESSVALYNTDVWKKRRTDTCSSFSYEDEILFFLNIWKII
jgi:hypothetical protein